MRLEDDDLLEQHMGELLWDADCGFRMTPARMESPFPNAFRMARYPDGRMTLQGAYSWSEGREGGIFWKEVPTVEVDEHGKGLMD